MSFWYWVLIGAVAIPGTIFSLILLSRGAKGTMKLGKALASSDKDAKKGDDKAAKKDGKSIGKTIWSVLKPILIIAAIVVAGVIGWHWLNALDRTPPTGSCRQMPLPGPQDNMPIGDYCYDLAAGQTLYVRPATQVEIIVEAPRAQLRVFDVYGVELRNQARTVGYRECIRLTVQWQRLEFKAEAAGRIRVRVGYFPDRILPC